MADLYHKVLDCGLELAGEYLPARRVVAVQFAFAGGLAAESPDQLGVAHLLEQTIDKGTENYTAEQFADAFDALGARRSSSLGRETMRFGCVSLAEFFEPVVALYAEMFRRPTFQAAQCDVARQLAMQELAALQDDPMELLEKLSRREALGPVLGRHPLGEPETIERLGRDEITEYWKSHFAASAMQVVVVGPIEPQRAAECLEAQFAGFGDGRRPQADDPPALPFEARRVYHSKSLEQEYMVISCRGARRQDEDWPAEAVAITVLAGGMSSRLFTEVREKQGLVYWVGAWADHPRCGGVVHIGASTTPQRCEQTYKTLLREVDRLAEDLSEAELQRAKVMISARRQTRGELTRMRAAQIAEDLFYFGRPRDRAEEIARIERVTMQDIRRYLQDHPRNPETLSVVTLGPVPLNPSG